MRRPHSQGFAEHLVEGHAWSAPERSFSSRTCKSELIFSFERASPSRLSTNSLTSPARSEGGRETASSANVTSSTITGTTVREGIAISSAESLALTTGNRIQIAAKMEFMSRSGGGLRGPGPSRRRVRSASRRSCTQRGDQMVTNKWGFAFDPSDRPFVKRDTMRSPSELGVGLERLVEANVEMREDIIGKTSTEVADQGGSVRQCSAFS
jgi:hypothetical protein